MKTWYRNLEQFDSGKYSNKAINLREMLALPKKVQDSLNNFLKTKFMQKSRLLYVKLITNNNLRIRQSKNRFSLIIIKQQGV